MSSISYAPITPKKTEFVDRSVTSATGASQVLAPANTERKELFLHNLSNKPWWINPTGGTAIADTAGNLLLEKGGTMSLTVTNAITAIGTTGKALTVLEA